MRSQQHQFGTTVAVLLAVVVAFFAGTAVLSTQASTPRLNSIPLQVQTAQPSGIATPATTNEQIYSGIYNQAAQSVVNINVVARANSSTGGSGSNEFDDLIEGTGTGFVVDQQGHIVTNNHVVDGAQRIEVSFFDGRIVRGEVIGLDPDSDLAVIQVSDVPAQALRPVTFADSASLFIGQEVIALGSPFGEEWTMTTGIISALNRTIRGLNDFSIGSVIQTDAAINPGNSGGPLFNLAGQVIGVNSQIISQTRSSAGIGFAIPSNLVVRVANDLINTGSVEYSYLGIGGGDVNLYYIDALNLANDVRGAVVTGVQRGSPAEAAGLQNPNPRSTTQIDGANVPTEVDIITAIDGTPITGIQSLIAYLAGETEPGQTINLTILRNGADQIQLPVTLTERASGQ